MPSIDPLSRFRDRLSLPLIERSEEMARALYRSWFVDFDPVHARALGQRHELVLRDRLPGGGWTPGQCGPICPCLAAGKLAGDKA